ncbi:MAG: hypothetical protein OK449_06725 [Thaumarchaeota archaeon]|nr:hypothetical protein [Nitrososphaerota archaeon]
MLSRVLRCCNELWRTQWARPEELRRLQEQRLREVVSHAYNNVPLYREKFDARGVKPGDIRSLDDLGKLPFTTKQEVMGGIPHRSIARGFDLRDCIRASTSGTSGGPMPVYYDKRFWDYCQAAWIFRKQWAIGVEPWRKVMIVEYDAPPKRGPDRSGEKAGQARKSPARESLGPMVRLLRGRRRGVTLFDNADQVLDYTLRFDPKLIRGAPSYLRLLAEAMADRGVEGLAGRVIRTEGELTDDETRRYLESSFKCRVYDEYSSWDFGNGAWQCERREGYHIDADLLIMEVVRGSERAQAGERGEVVVTNLMNYAMPLIRYRVGDIGVLDDRYCSCGRSLPLLKSVEGRRSDCFQLPGGQLITPRTVMNVIQGSPGVSRYQAVQESVGKVRIQLMKREGEPDADKEQLMSRCRSILGESMEIEVSVTDRTNFRAKFRPVISKLPVAKEHPGPRGLLEMAKSR